MLSKVLIFVFAIAFVNASVELGTSTYSSTGAGTISSAVTTPTAAPVVQTPTVAQTLTNKYTALVEKATTVFKLSADQKASADAITMALSAARTETNNKLAAYLIATAFVDAKLIPFVEKASTDARIQAIQAKYTATGFQGRGFVHFTGAFNYNRYSTQFNLNLSGKPDLLLNADVAANILVNGALSGFITGQKIEKFIPATGSVDLIAARTAINGNYLAAQVKSIAEQISA
jgi:hypothetical protein